MSDTTPPAAPAPPSRLLAALAARGDRTAVITADTVVSYAELSDRVAAVATQLGTNRRLVLLEGRSTLAWLVGYLACHSVGYPVVLVPPDGGTSVRETYDPDIVLSGERDAVQVWERRPRSLHHLHPQLALLLSTSGSSGSPKLVRLSQGNLLANAESVAASLGVRPTDRAITTLPVHYCYGLSVVHSHLLRSAALVLTEASVVEERFWQLFERSAATCFAGVPYTFDLLDRTGFADRDLASLRYVTQAGGRLAPERVRAYAELGVERGWDLFVMYGQTEATARMAVLPPDLAATRPTSIGLPVPGGSFALEPVGENAGPVRDGEVGELVYTGANVMMGYATAPSDLARGPELHRLPTGDLARRAPDGLYEVVGRSSRFLKVFGLRIDQGHLEAELSRGGATTCCEPTPDGGLGVIVESGGPTSPAQVLLDVLALTALPRHAVRVVPVDALPRRPSGKVDEAAVRSLLARGGDEPANDVLGVFADVLGRPAGDGDSFVSLGGDSLSYVEMTVRLERLLGRVPDGWHLLTVRQLADDRAPAAVGPGPSARLDLTVALRAVAILLVVGSHSKVFDILGGAHLLLVVAGYNLARFQLAAPRRPRTLAIGRSLARIIVPASIWIGGVAVLTGQYSWQNVLLLNHALGPATWGPTWNLWFLEALVLLLAAITAALALRPVDDLYRRHPFAFSFALTGVGLLVRFEVLAVPTGPRERFTAVAVLWLVALGMAAAHAGTRPQRAVVVLVGTWGLWGWFGDPQREAVVLVAVVLLVWVKTLPSRPAINAIAAALAAASLSIYLTHWQIYPLWQHEQPLLALAASLAVGLAHWQAVRRSRHLLLAVARHTSASGWARRPAGGRTNAATLAAGRATTPTRAQAAPRQDPPTTAITPTCSPGPSASSARSTTEPPVTGAAGSKR